MRIRTAEASDVPELIRLLRQIAALHREGRPDLFLENASKYGAEELRAQIAAGALCVLVAEETLGALLGYAMGTVLVYPAGAALRPHRAFYLDDLCVDEAARGRAVGKALMEAVEQVAKTRGCAYVELNVWTCNAPSKRFYEKRGYTERSVRMEKRL